MAKVESKLVIPAYHNNLSGLNEGEYLHLNIAEKEKFDNLQLYLDSKLDKNNLITPGSFAKITYDAKGLVTGGSNASISDINSLQDALDLKMTGNSAITGGTYTKITYDSKGLVTGGSNATTADINDSFNKRYVVDTDLIKLGNLSGVNTGDQNLNYIASLTDGTVELSNGNDAIIPLASEFHAGLLSPGEKDLIETAVQPGQLDDIAFSGDVPWSSIVGDINLQTDLQNQFDTKLDHPNGTALDYINGEGDAVAFPTSFPVEPHTHEISDIIGLEEDLGEKVPYTGATANVDLGANELKAKALEVDTSNPGTSEFGKITYNSTRKGLSTKIQTINGISPDFNFTFGQQQIELCHNDETISILKGQVVYSSGGDGAKVSVKLARANAESTSSKTFGVAQEDIPAGGFGWIATGGLVQGLNLTGIVKGSIYLSPDVAGEVTNIRPSAPNHMVTIGVCVANTSVIFVNIANGFELDELHDVKITDKAEQQSIDYNSALGVWENTWTFMQYVTGFITKPVNLNAATADVDGYKKYEYEYSFGKRYRKIITSPQLIDEFYLENSLTTLIKKRSI
jgi:hypothetical protein